MSSKQIITSPELEDGGKLWPARGLPGGSGILPEDEEDELPPLTDVSKELPKDGLVISPRWMADAIAEGRKKLIVKTRPFELAGKRFVLISERLALGVVELGEMHKVPDRDELRRWTHEHLINEEVLRNWCSKQKSWCEGPYYKWKVGVVQAFDEPLRTNVPTGPQVLVHDVEVKKSGPFKRWGGSAKYSGVIASALPEHEKFVEPFAGAASVLFAKEPSKQEVLADLDAEVVHAFKMIQKLDDALVHKLSSKDRAVSKDKLFRLRDAAIPTDPVERLHRFLYLQGAAWSGVRTGIDTGRTLAYKPERLRGFAERLKGVKVYKAPYERTLEQEDSRNTLFFLDPPYPGEWSKDADDLDHDASKFDVGELLKCIQRLKGTWLLVLGDTKEQINALRSLDSTMFSIELRESRAESSGGAKYAKRYFATNDSSIASKVKSILRSRRGARSAEMRKIAPKRVALKPDTDPEELNADELRQAHWQLHLMHRDKAASPKSVEGWSLEDIVNLHARVVDELFGRKGEHPPPPDDGLDETSADFERHAADQPSWHEEPMQKVDKRYMVIERSGDDLGREITLEEVLAKFETFKVRKPFISLVGGLANHGKTKGDIDILINDDGTLPEALLHVLHFRLGRGLGELAERLQIHSNELVGPFTNFVELYDMTIERVNPQNEVKQMRDGSVEEIEKRGPFKRWGGSANYAKRVVARFPDHKRYVEPFAGAASCLFVKERAGEEVLADLDAEVVHAFKMIKRCDEKMIATLERMDRVVTKDKLKAFCKGAIPKGDLERLHRFLYVQGGSFSGKHDGNPPAERIGKEAYQPKRLLRFAERLGSVEIVQADYRETIRRFDGPNTLFFIDPPYPGEWTNDADDLDHNAGKFELEPLVKTVEAIKGSYVLVLGDTKEQLKALGQLNAHRFSLALRESSNADGSRGGFKTARRYFATNAKRATVDKARKLTLFDFFEMPKPTRAAQPEQPQTVENFLKLYRERPEWLPTLVQKKFDGANHQAHRDGDKVRIISEDGDDNTDRLPKMVEELKRLGPNSFVVCLEIERWGGAQHLPREAAAGYINAKGEPDDETAGIVGNVYDLLYVDGEDIHTEPVEQRVAQLAKLKFKQSTMGAPDLTHRLNRAPSLRADTVSQLEKIVRRVRALPGSEGVVAKRVASPYRLGKETFDEWVKYHSATTVRGVVRGREKTKAGAWVYQWGVLPGRGKPAEIEDVKGRKVVPVGDTFATSLDFAEGDRILVEVETLNWTKRPEGEELTGWVPRVMGPYTGAPDTIDAAVRRARGNLVLQQKEVDEKGEVTYVPTRKRVEKGKTVAALLVEAGPPNEWSGGVASVLGKEGQRRVTALWNALDAAWKKRVMAAFHKMFDAVDVMLELEDAYPKLAKQQDPYLEIPDEDGHYRYTVQHHWRGRSMHADLRIVLRQKQLLIGWTLDTLIAGAVKEPVDTLAKAEAQARRMEEISKVNWNTGEWAARPRRGAAKPVRTLIRSQRKAPEPFVWLNVEGKTKDPQPGKPPPVGGTKNFPGVFHIVDSGAAQYGAQKATTHEYFFQGGALNYRVVWRILRLGRRTTKGEMPELCTMCKREPASHGASWADRPDDVSPVCHACVDAFVRLDGEAVSKYVLPPSKAPEEREFTETWFALLPDDPRPNVLQPDEVKEGWMPPLGYSALPREVRAQVPKELRYWGARTKAKAKELRAALFDAIKRKEIEVDFEAPYGKRREKLTQLDARFVLQVQLWRGPIQIRTGPSRQLWWLRIDTGAGQLITVKLLRDPLENKQVVAEVGKSPRSTFDIQGEVPPGTTLNPTKETPSYIERLDGGKASVLNASRDWIKVELKGKRLKGLFGLRRDPSSGEWLWQPARAGPDTVEKIDLPGKYEARLTVPIIKVDEEHGIITGVVLEPETRDAQGDIISKEVIERAAHDFLSRYGQPGGSRLGDMHKSFGDIGWKLIECWIHRGDGKLGKGEVKDGSWLMSWQRTDDAKGREAFAKVKRGERTGFSIGGVATVA